MSKRWLALLSSVTALFIVIGLVLLWGFSITLVDIVDWVWADILLADDQYRGIGSGFSGRDETWVAALSMLSSNPIFGVGLDNAVINEADLRVHSGPILLLSEFGTFSILLFIILVRGVWRTYSHDKTAFAALIACLFVFLFQARGLNVNVFPLLMWLLCLPWALTPFRGEIRI